VVINCERVTLEMGVSLYAVIMGLNFRCWCVIKRGRAGVVYFR